MYCFIVEISILVETKRTYVRTIRYFEFNKFTQNTKYCLPQFKNANNYYLLYKKDHLTVNKIKHRGNSPYIVEHKIDI